MSIWYTGSARYRKLMVEAAAALSPPVAVALGNASQIFPGNFPLYRRIITQDETLPMVHVGSAAWHERLDTIELITNPEPPAPDPDPDTGHDGEPPAPDPDPDTGHDGGDCEDPPATLPASGTAEESGEGADSQTPAEPKTKKRGRKKEE